MTGSAHGSESAVKIVLHVRPNPHDDPDRRRRNDNVFAMRDGLLRHGMSCVVADWDEPVDGDAIVVWGWRNQRMIERARGRQTPVLVLERGHTPPRLEWISCGWNGLGGRAVYPQSNDGGVRWTQHFRHLLKDWRQDGRYALVLGQVPGDMATKTFDLNGWKRETISSLRRAGERVRYRPHPLVVEKRPFRNWSSKVFPRTLEEDFEGASRALAVNSTATVEAVLAGIPSVTFDEGAMAWPVTTHDVASPAIRPDRTGWCHDLAWSQWRLDEIRSGDAWDALVHAEIN